MCPGCVATCDVVKDVPCHSDAAGCATDAADKADAKTCAALGSCATCVVQKLSRGA